MNVRADTPSSSFTAWIFLGISLAGVFLCGMTLQRVSNPYPPLSSTLSTSLTDLNDLGGVLLGLRRITADIAWIETLQYYGTEEEGFSDFELDNGMGRYPDFLTYCLRTTRLDPHFTYVYYYGAGALGWNLNRLDEAETLLKEGILRNPTEWRLAQYLAGLSYQKNHDMAKLTIFLESFVSAPDCPNLLRALLANIYTKNKQYRDALRIWFQVLDTGEPDYVQRAQLQIRKISALAGLSGALPAPQNP